jgi:hypothetical protein
VNEILIGFSVSGFVGHIPAQRLKHRIDEFNPNQRLVVSLVLIGLNVLIEPLNQGFNLIWDVEHAWECNREASF